MYNYSNEKINEETIKQLQVLANWQPREDDIYFDSDFNVIVTNPFNENIAICFSVDDFDEVQITPNVTHIYDTDNHEFIGSIRENNPLDYNAGLAKVLIAAFVIGYKINVDFIR